MLLRPNTKCMLGVLKQGKLTQQNRLAEKHLNFCQYVGCESTLFVGDRQIKTLAARLQPRKHSDPYLRHRDLLKASSTSDPVGQASRQPQSKPCKSGQPDSLTPQRVARAPQESQKTSSFCTSTTPIRAEGRAADQRSQQTSSFCTSTTPIPAERCQARALVAQTPPAQRL